MAILILWCLLFLNGPSIKRAFVLRLPRWEESLIEFQEGLLVIDEEIQDNEAISGSEFLNLDLLALQLSKLVEALFKVSSLRV